MTAVSKLFVANRHFYAQGIQNSGKTLIMLFHLMFSEPESILVLQYIAVCEIMLVFRSLTTNTVLLRCWTTFALHFLLGNLKILRSCPWRSLCMSSVSTESKTNVFRWSLPTYIINLEYRFLPYSLMSQSTWIRAACNHWKMCVSAWVVLATLRLNFSNWIPTLVRNQKFYRWER